MSAGAALGAVPIDIGRDEAADAARHELAKPIYGDHQAPLLSRILERVWDFVAHLLGRAVEAAPGGALGVLAVIVLVGLVVALLLWRVGPLRRTAAEPRVLFAGQVRSSADHRAAADRAAEAGDWDTAVRERFRAVVRVLEERDALDERPGRTADEASSDAARVLPECAAALVRGARTFDEVAYGGRAAQPGDDADLRELDRVVSRAPVRVVTPA